MKKGSIRLGIIRAGLMSMILGLGLFNPAASQVLNQLSPTEVESGWKLIFDGKTNTGWIHPDGTPGKFVPEDSALRTNGGDICTKDEYDNFELAIDYKYDAGGNSGIFVRTKKGIDPPWLNGMEVAIQDNGRANNLYKNGDLAVYDVKAPSKDKWLGPLKWNKAVIWMAGPKLEHWHNGEKVIDQDMGTAEWRALVADSKFADKEFVDNNWGKETKGQVCLQDHGPDHKIWFRNIKIRTLALAQPLAVPTVSPKGGTFAGPVEVRLSVAVVGAAVHYTLDGSAPTASSPVYSAPIMVTRSQTLKAIAVRTGYASSAVRTEEYQVGPSASRPISEEGFQMAILGNGSEVMLSLALPAASNHGLSLHDLEGRLVKPLPMGRGRMLLSLRGVEPGMYLLRVDGPGLRARKLVQIL